MTAVLEPSPPNPERRPEITRRKVRTAALVEVSLGHQVVVLLTVVVTVWLLISSVVLPLPFTVRGREARGWLMGLALVLSVFAAARQRAPSRTRTSAVVLLLGGLAMTALPFMDGGDPEGPCPSLGGSSFSAEFW